MKGGNVDVGKEKERERERNRERKRGLRGEREKAV